MSNSRKKNIFLNLFTGIGNNIIIGIIGFISAPISLSYWQLEKYGIWALVTSLFAYLSITGFGIDYAASILMTKTNDFQSKMSIFKKSMILLILFCLVALVIFIIVHFTFPGWVKVLGKIPANYYTETFFAIFVSFLFFLINLPFNIVHNSFSAFQKAYIGNVFATVAIILSFVSLLIVIALKGSLIGFALISGSSFLILNVIKTFYFFKVIIKTKINYETNIEPQTLNENEVKETGVKNIVITGLRLMGYSLAVMFTANVSNIIISNQLGVAKIAPYAMTTKLYGIAFTLITTLIYSFFSILGKEFGNNNWPWIIDMHKRMSVMTFLFASLIWIGGILFFYDVIHLWVGSKGYAGFWATFFLGGWFFLSILSNFNYVFINSFNYSKEIFIVTWAEAILFLFLSLMLIKHFGFIGLALGAFLSSLITTFWMLPFIVYKRSSKKLFYNFKFILKSFFICLLPTLFFGILIQSHIQHFWLRSSLNSLLLVCFITFNYILLPLDLKEYILNMIMSVSYKTLLFRKSKKSLNS